MVHDRDPVRERERLFLIMRDVDEGHPDFLLQGDQLELHPLLELGIESCQRLIQQQQARPVDQRPRYGHALTLATGQLVRKALLHAEQRNIVERFMHPGSDLLGRHAVHPEREGDVLRHGHVGKQGVALEHGVDVAILRRDPGHVLAIEENAATVGLVEARDHAQQRGLAAAGGSEEGEELASLDGQADGVDRCKIPKTSGDLLNLEKGHRGAQGCAAQ